ncbi:MAG: DUF4350 domain-containing protein [Chitinispirillaceae bacterium]
MSDEKKSVLKKIRADKAIKFLKEHKLFTAFFVCLCLINLFLILKEKPKVESYTCSTHDKGPYGTSSLFRFLDEKKVKVSRMGTPSFVRLKKKESGNTLVMLSPRFNPPVWEWEHILSWVAQGNRLITSGRTFPKVSFFKDRKGITTYYAREKLDDIEVMLPVHQNCPDVLESNHQVGISFFDKTRTEPGDTILLSHINKNFIHDDMVPLLSMDKKIIGAKKAIGKGEWIVFTQPNPMSNDLLKHSSWYKFALSLLIGNSAFGKSEIIFDEFHNGFRATESLWELLRFYKFDKGLLFLGILGILFLFFSGIRTAPPSVTGYRYVKDVIPGLKAMGNLVCRHKAHSGLLKRELELIKTELVGRSDTNLSESELYALYTRKGRLPGEMTKDDFENRIKEVHSGGNPEPEYMIGTYNLFVHMRKELRL